jgi:hyperosmotically inducible periplasmic protein
MTTSIRIMASLVAVSAAALLAGCDKLNDLSAAGKADDPTQVADARSAGGERMGGAMPGGDPAARHGNVSDSAITASIKAELAKDAALSALRISVESNHGLVMLRGMAPDTAAKERATQLASAIKGVASVDNQMTVTQ